MINGRIIQNTAFNQIVEPVALDELRDHVRVEHNEEDAYLSALIPVSRSAAERYIDGIISDRSFTLYMANFEEFITLPMRPLQVDSVVIAYTDDDDIEQNITNDNLLVDWGVFSAKVMPVWGESWPVVKDGKDKVRVTFTSGFAAAEGSVPPDIKHAIMMIAATLYDQREDHTAAVELKNVPLSSQLLLDSYRKIPV